MTVAKNPIDATIATHMSQSSVPALCIITVRVKILVQTTMKAIVVKRMLVTIIGTAGGGTWNAMIAETSAMDMDGQNERLRVFRTDRKAEIMV